MVIRSGSPNKFKAFSIELNTFGAHYLLQDKPSGVVADNQAIRLRLIHEICVDDPAGAGHVFDNDCRITGNVLAYVASDGARISVVTSTRRKRDDQPNGLPSIETIIGCGISDSRQIKTREREKNR